MRRARLGIGLAALGAAANLSSALLRVAVLPEVRSVQIGVGLLLALLLPLLRWIGSLSLVGNSLALLFFALAMFLGLTAGTEVGLYAAWLVPLFAVLLLGARAGVLWTVLSIAGISSVALMSAFGIEHPLPKLVTAPGGSLRGGLLLIPLSLLVALTYEWLKNRALGELDEARERAEAAHRERLESEERFRMLTENATDVITEWDENGRILYISPQIAKVIGDPGATFVGSGWEDRVDSAQSAELERFRADLQRGLGVGEQTEASFRFRHRDGGWRWLEVVARPFRAANGEVHFVSVARDVTERREVETLRRLTRQLEQTIREREEAGVALRASEQKYQDLYDNAPDMFGSFDAATAKMVECNLALAATLGFSKSEILGRSVFELYHPDCRAEVERAFRAFVETGEAHADELQLQRADGSALAVSLKVSAVRDEEGRILQSRSIWRDITERKRYEERLEEAALDLAARNTELARANRELEEFTSVAWHDLQEPLRRMISFSGLLREDVGPDLPEKAERDLELLEDGAHRMRRLVLDLLELSRAGATEMRRELLRVDTCVDEALEDLGLGGDDTRARIEREPLPELRADRTLLTCVYRNLIGNALKFTEKPVPVIRLGVERDGDHVVLSVADDGIGISPDKMDEIFKPFGRLYPASRYEGTGIGLAICRKAVERHGGRIWVESEPGQGAQFRFTLDES